MFRFEGAEIICTPVRAPTANAYAERWVGTVRAECLECLLIMGRGQLEQVLRAYVQQSSTTTGTVRTGRWACKRRTQPLS